MRPIVWTTSAIRPAMSSGRLTVETAIDLVEERPAAMGVCRGNWGLRELAGAAIRRWGAADVHVSTWTANGAILEESQCWFEVYGTRGLQLTVRDGFGERLPAWCARVQKRWGPRALLVALSHAELGVLVGDGWQLTITGTCTFGARDVAEVWRIDRRAAVSRPVLRWFDALPALPRVSHAADRQLSLDDEIRGAWK